MSEVEIAIKKLEKKTVYVLGPLELSPGHFSVGEKSYAAIKGKFPYYNELRQRLYEDGMTEAADALGEIETCAMTAEEEYKKSVEAKEAADRKIDALTKQIEKDAETHEKALKDLRKMLRRKKAKKMTSKDGVVVTVAEDEPDELLDINIQLRAALEPFAECKVAKEYKDDEIFVSNLKVKHLRYAKKLLEILDKDPEGKTKTKAKPKTQPKVEDGDKDGNN